MSADSIRRRNREVFDGAFGRVYSFYMARPSLSRAIGVVLWGGDVTPFYASMAAIGKVPDGGLVVDAPCGAGVVFRALSPRQRARYLGVDISPAMLRRARKQAVRLGLDQVELVEGDAERIPVEDDRVDLFLSYWGLHCMPDPEAAVREIARCLRPGGRLVGSMICRGDSLRQRLMVRPGAGGFGPGGRSEDLVAWLERSGLERGRLQLSGPFAYFEATA